MKNGSITAEQALLYEIFLLFNDPRLPAAYRGDDSHLYETDVLARAVRQFESLSPETRATLTPFLLLPSEPGSWADPAVQPSQAAREPDVVEFPSLLCKGRHTPDWIPATRPGAHVQVWYDRTEPGDDTLANTLLNVIESTIWPKLFGTLGVKAPLPDAEPPSNLDCAGSDQRLDVFLVDIGSYHGLTYPRDNAQAFTNCKAVPSVIYVNKNKPAHEAIVTHELMHASQNAYNSVACTDAYGWLKDATAQWAIDYVFHGALGDNQIEQGWADCYTRSPQKALDDRSAGSCSRMGRNTNRDYGSYLFFQFMSNNGSPALVKAALDNLEGYATSLEAVARVSGSGADYFRDKWKDFSKALLNRTFPGGFLQPNFQTWDSLADTPEMLGDEVWSGVTDKKFIFTPSIANLSTHFYRFTFPDTSARSFLFRNGFFKAYKNDNKAIRVTALWHDASGTWREEDWSGYEFVGLCRDRKDQRTDVLYVIVSNGEWQSSGGGTLSTSEPFFLEASNIGCWKYKGTSACQLDGTPSGGSTRVESVVSFAQDARMNGLTSTHPMIPDSLRTGVHLLMPLAVGGAAADGSYTLSASRTTGNCPFTFGITSPLGGTESGVLQLNTFPDLEVPPAGGDLVTFVANPGRAYRMAASSIKIYTAQPPGQKPSGQPCDPELVPVTVLAFAPEPPQPLVSANGNISFSSSSPNCVGTLQPQLEP